LGDHFSFFLSEAGAFSSSFRPPPSEAAPSFPQIYIYIYGKVGGEDEKKKNKSQKKTKRDTSLGRD